MTFRAEAVVLEPPTPFSFLVTACTKGLALEEAKKTMQRLGLNYSNLQIFHAGRFLSPQKSANRQIGKSANRL